MRSDWRHRRPARFRSQCRAAGLTKAGQDSYAYALDFLVPGFILSPENFVMHANARRADHIVYRAMQVNERSGRVTYGTVGKMPGRQVIVYDKRAEITAKRKVAGGILGTHPE